jgi:ATP-dependent exoDNAse (exonuclease V) beta subunit
VLTFQCTKSEYQGRIVAREITGFLARHTRADGSPISYSDVIVLCPSGNFVAGMREALLKVDIPSREVARPVVPDHMWKVILILRFALNHDNIAFRSWLDVVNVDPVDIDAVRRAAMDEQTNLIGYCENGPNVDARTVLEHAKHLREHSDGTPELAAALAAFPGLELSEEAITEIVSYLLRGDGSLSPRREWLGILYRKYGILEDESASGPDDAVLVTTFHSAKGLEGELVCLTWMNDLHMPLAGRDVEEQRRLLYVGMTRAKQELIITFHETFEEGRGLLRIEAMSRFLRGIISYLTVTRIMAKDLL